MATLQQMFDVRGKSVIVTGGASGIGRAYAEVMADNGARVCIFDIDAAGLDAAVVEIGAGGGEVWGQVVDVSDRSRMAAAFDAVAERHGRSTWSSPMPASTPGRAFCRPRASASPKARSDVLDDRHWDRVIAVNLTSVYTTVKHAARHMKRTGGGRIIVTSSIAAQINESDRRHALYARQGGGRPFRPADGDGTGRVRHPRQLHLARSVHDQHRRTGG